MQIHVFDIWADYAHFRKYYTTTSPLSFSFPPPSTIAGILGAITGLNKESNEYLKVFNLKDYALALRILNPIKKIRVGINFVDTRGSNMKKPMSDKKYQNRVQINTELLKQPKYRIYLSCLSDLSDSLSEKSANIFNILINNIKNHKTVYTISLGLSELLADFQYIGTYNCEEWHDKNYNGLYSSGNNYNHVQRLPEICSVIPEYNMIDGEFEIEDNKQYFKESKVPVNMDDRRIVKCYSDVVFEPTGLSIRAKLNKYYTINNNDRENVTFFSVPSLRS
jgi:CRISPR-associated protein Cas5h